jgi:CheY-like chemotaxis protein
MNGLIEQAQAQAQQPQQGTPPLEPKGAIGEIEKNIKPELFDQYERLVAAGMKVMYAPETRNVVQKYLSGPEEPVTKAVKGVMSLLGLLTQKSKTKIEMDVLMPVAMTLMVEALDVLSQKGDIEFTPDVVAQAMSMFVEMLMTQLGVSNEMLTQRLGEMQGGQ